jgi:ppGpp synthetase/RelA/SpoT-type nucleotidyltranferase
MWATMDMENIGKRTETTDSNITNRVQAMELRITCVEDTMEDIDKMVKENAKVKKFLTQNIH